MKTSTQTNKKTNWARYLSMGLFVFLTTSCTYMKMNPPPDTDKAFLNNNNSCYLATAANILAGAGYGSGTTVQTRAADIYGNLTAQFGTANSGWTDTALSWWLTSTHNTWTTNPYTVVTVYGNKTPKNPWANANGSRDIANELRQCHFVGLSISWPTNAAGQIGSGGHAITGWGDRSWLPWNDYNDPITDNSEVIRLADSDQDTGGDVQQYRYDDFTNPNPGGANEGNGWYINYDPNHPYIKHIVTLSPTQKPGGGEMIQRVVGSYKIHQDNLASATDLHYQVGTDVEILSYNTRLDWGTENAPDIQENQPHRTRLIADWDLSDKPVPQSNWITITTEFILRNWNAIDYSNVNFTYPDGTYKTVLPAISWNLRSPAVPEAAQIANVTGGYVVASFDVIDPRQSPGKKMVGSYRLIHQYSFTQAPEKHTFHIKGENGFEITHLRFGHSYSYLSRETLWTFQEWLTDLGNTSYKLSSSPAEVNINWSGRLPYPKGEDIKGRIPDIKRGLMQTSPEMYEKKDK